MSTTQCAPGTTQVSPAAYQQARGAFEFDCKPNIPVKGKDNMNIYVLLVCARGWAPR